MTTVEPRRRKAKQQARDRQEQRGTTAPPEGRRRMMRSLRSMTPLKAAAGVVGVAFLLVGILGFVPVFTTGYGEMSFADAQSGALLFGAFRVTLLANLVHLAFGLVGLGAALNGLAARYYLLLGGVLSLLLWMAGLTMDPLDSPLNVVALGLPHSWLHFAFGAVMVALGGGLSAIQTAGTRRA